MKMLFTSALAFIPVESHRRNCTMITQVSARNPTPVESELIELILNSDTSLWRELHDASLSRGVLSVQHEFLVTDGVRAAAVRAFTISSGRSLHWTQPGLCLSPTTSYSVKDLRGIEGDLSDTSSAKVIWEAAAERMAPLKAALRERMRNALAEVTLDPALVKWETGQGGEIFLGQHDSLSLEVRRISKRTFGLRKEIYELSVTPTPETASVSETVSGDAARAVFAVAALSSQPDFPQSLR